MIEQNKILEKSIEELELTSRSMNCLKSNNIFFIRDLVKYTEDELSNIKNLGKKSLREIQCALAFRNMRLRMIKECPFCGIRPRLKKINMNHYAIACGAEKCGVICRVPKNINEKIVIDLWNTRY